MLLSVNPAAPTPKPRLANALQRVHLLAPAYLLASAWIQASRAETTISHRLDNVSRPYKEVVHTCWVARLESKRINEEVKEHNVAFRAAGISAGSGRPAVSGDEASIDVVEHVCPDFSDV